MVGQLWLSSISNYPKTGLLFYSRFKSDFFQSLYGRTDSHYEIIIPENYGICQVDRSRIFPRNRDSRNWFLDRYQVL
ncbi:hypothetical protein MiSe_49710 [Microseira wollei NIES-4236]|uniref:Uncharacterized protein n=1 Tax=Microseira wollei NIES-4236 TaxID=2530354 RepID=A0AAV3XCB5_9CYAN|nr:hypothetical protein MiSe_49710 [Microseira wollei NIES-4236]